MGEIDSCGGEGGTQGVFGEGKDGAGGESVEAAVGGVLAEGGGDGEEAGDSAAGRWR